MEDNSPTLNLLFSSFVSTFAGSFHFGYSISAINPLSHILQNFVVDNINTRYRVTLTEPQTSIIWSAIASSIFLGALIGGYLSVGLLEKHGPKQALLVSAVLLLISSPMFGLSYVVGLAELMPISRILVGIGLGIGVSSQVLYSISISPVKYRGIVSVMGGIVGNLGFLSAAVLGTPFLLGTADLWSHIFFIQCLPSLIFIICNLLFLHDSPTYLIQNNEIRKAEESIKFNFGKDTDVTRTVLDIRKDLSQIGESKSFRDILTDRCAIRALSLAIALNFSVAFSGIVAMSLFGTQLFENIGYSPRASSIVNCLTAIPPIISSLIMANIIDRFGRRVILIPSLIILAIINILMMFLIFLNESSKNIVVSWTYFILFVMFLFIFSIGIGPAGVFLGAELAPPGTTSKMQFYSISTQYIGSCICPILYTVLSEEVGGLALFLFIIPLSVTALYLYLYLPETKGKTQNEIYDLLSR